MKARVVRLYTGDIHPFLQPDRLKPAGQPGFWRAWIAWERFPADAAGPLKLVAQTELEGEQEQTRLLVPGLSGSLQRALNLLVDVIKITIQ